MFILRYFLLVYLNVFLPAQVMGLIKYCTDYGILDRSV